MEQKIRKEISIEQVERMVALIEKHDNIILFPHLYPDGDSIAASFGFAQLLKENYPNKIVKVAGEIEDFTPHLRYMDEFVDWEAWMVEKPVYDDYLAVVGDACFTSRIKFWDRFEPNIKNTIIIDHHSQETDIKNVDEIWQDSYYPATAIMIYEFAMKANLRVGINVAIILAAGILTDTEMFALSNGRPEVFDTFGALTKIFDMKKYNRLFELLKARSKKQLEFEIYVLSNYNLVKDVAYMRFDKATMDKLDMTPEEVMQHTDLLSFIKEIKYWVFFVEFPEDVKVEIRSVCECRSVADMAIHFGGGGHAQRSGTVLQSMDDSQEVIDYIVKTRLVDPCLIGR